MIGAREQHSNDAQIESVVHQGLKHDDRGAPCLRSANDLTPDPSTALQRNEIRSDETGNISRAS